MAKKTLPDVTRPERVPRQAFLAQRGLAPCPCHATCAADWGIAPTYDVCPRETSGGVSECPSLSQEGDHVAYQSLATDGDGQAGREDA